MRTKIADAADLIAGFAFKSKDFGNNYSDKVIKITHITPPNVNMKELSSVDMSKYDRNKLEKYIARKGDFVFAMTGATIGKIGRIEEGEAYLNQRVMMFKPRSIVDKDFFYYVLQQYDFYQYVLNHIDSESAQPNISATTVGKYEFDSPKIETQRKIGRILRYFDEKAETNNRINDNLSQQIEALLMAFLDSKDTMPVKLGDYLYIKGRIGWKGLKKSEYLSRSGYRIINGETLTKSGIDWNKAGYISEERYTESPEIMLQVGDILLSKDGTIGKIGYVDTLELPTSVASGIFVIRNNKPDIISTTFIYYLLKSRLFESFIAARKEGSVIPHLYQKDFMEFEFPLPTSDRMTEFEKLTESMFSRIVNNLNENKKLATLRDILLPKLMSGELDVSELDL